jgi:hypothetical protein
MYTADTSATDVLVAATRPPDYQRQLDVKKRRVISLSSARRMRLAAGGLQQFSAYGRRNTGDSVNVSVAHSATGGPSMAPALLPPGSSPEPIA